MSDEWEVVEHLEHGPENPWLEVNGAFNYYKDNFLLPAIEGEIEESVPLYPEEQAGKEAADKIEQYFFSGDMIFAPQETGIYAINMQYQESEAEEDYDISALNVDLLEKQE